MRAGLSKVDVSDSADGADMSRLAEIVSDIAPSHDRFATIDDLQDYLLTGVSRTFAPTIRRLPPRLARAVTNAYLLCRLLDTIEDEPTFTLQEKRRFSEYLISAIAGARSARQLRYLLMARASEAVTPAERELIAAMPEVIAFTASLDATERTVISRCVQEMASGMVEFQARPRQRGLDDVPQLDRYCYYVAGVVGNMLTHLFCAHSSQIARHRDALFALATSFGQGLQMINILKDVWDDLEHGFCWLPRKVFTEQGFDLNDLRPGCFNPAFDRAFTQLIGLAHGHLRNAFKYALLIPAAERGIREFCLWPIGLALLTLRNLNARRDFQSGNEVKVSRSAVRTMFLLSPLVVRRDGILRRVFQFAGEGLPIISPS